MSPDFSSYPDNVREVASISDMITSDFSQDENVLLVRRDLKGDFESVADQVFSRLGGRSKVWFRNGAEKMHGDKEMRQFFSLAKPMELNPFCLLALEQITKDIEELRRLRYKATLRLERENPHGGFHIDGRGNKKLHSRVLVNYSGAQTLGYHPRDVNSLPASGLVVDFKSGAQPFSMGLGNIWRHAGEYNGITAPFVHSSPIGNDCPRLLLVADPYGSDPG